MALEFAAPTWPVIAGDSMTEAMWDDLRDGIRDRSELVDYGGDPASNVPTAISAGDPPQYIAAYRTAIDNLASSFYIPSTIADGTYQKYTATTLHEAAFGPGNTSWQYGSDDLTPPCPPHKALWNDMKDCLLLLKWILIDENGSWPKEDAVIENRVDTPGNWDASRSNGFADMTSLGDDTAGYVGRFGIGYYDAPESGALCTGHEFKESEFKTPSDFTALTNPPTPEEGYFNFSWTGFVADNYDDLDVLISLAGTQVTTGAYTIDASLGVGGDSESIHLDDAVSASIVMDGSTENDLRIECEDVYSDPGSGAWPEPPALGDSYTDCILLSGTWQIYMSFTWD